MKKRQQPQPKYADGDKVKANGFVNGTLTVSGTPMWNGLTWMYSFEGLSMRLGQRYIQPA